MSGNAWNLSLEKETCSDVAAGLDREWLVTNGLGGYASGSILGAATRSYHGLLVAALRPPVERFVLVAKTDEEIALPAGQVLRLGVNEYEDGTIDPQGQSYLVSFALEGDIPCFTYQLAPDLKLEKRIWMEYGENTTYVQYLLRDSSGQEPLEQPLMLTILPSCLYRDHHTVTQGRVGWNFLVEDLGCGCEIRASLGAVPYRLQLGPEASFLRTGLWYWHLHHRQDQARGLNSVEDVYQPGTFSALLLPGVRVTLVISAEEQPAPALGTSGHEEYVAQALRRHQRRIKQLLDSADHSTTNLAKHDPVHARLTLAADQFIVTRAQSITAKSDMVGEFGATLEARLQGYGQEVSAEKLRAVGSPGGKAPGVAPNSPTISKQVNTQELAPLSRPGNTQELASLAKSEGALKQGNTQKQQAVARDYLSPDSKTIIAGYPWFTDWGRDSMISLPGLLLWTGRYSEARGLFRAFISYVHEGLIPNRFPDRGEAPEYNTADATLWLFHALHEYLTVTGDRSLLKELFPSLVEIIQWHQRGTSFGIGMDPQDGLLRASSPGLQLTWMDAKIGSWVVTPRRGKPVEVNALWHFALACMEKWAVDLSIDAFQYGQLRSRIEQSFAGRFWYPLGGYLYDVVDVDGMVGRNDASLRPNQLFAVSLSPHLLSIAQTRSILQQVTDHLLTPMGLRTLSPQDPAYHASFNGDPLQRDSAYHQGAVWPWLLGPYIDVHMRVYHDCSAIMPLLKPLIAHLWDGCLGTISEVAEPEPPFAPAGCFAQAWSVAELLRIWVMLAD